MAEYELRDDSSVGALVRARIRNFEKEHPDGSVYVADNRGMWDVRFTYGRGSKQRGTAYIGAPEAVGQATRLRWPPGQRADIDKITFENTAGLEGFILAVLRFESGEEKPKSTSI